MRTLIIALALLLATAPARADEVGVVVTGEATLQPQLVSQLESWLREHGHRVAVSPLEPDAINTLVDCFVIDDLGCARGVIDKRSKSRSVVFARIEVTPNGSERDMSITGYWFQKNHDAQAERRVCKSCNDAKLRTAVDDVLTALAAEPPTALEGSSKVEPAKAPMPVDDVDSESHGRLVPMVVIGAGAAALITGAVLIALNQDEHVTGVQEPTLRKTMTGGIVLGVGGVAAIGVGVYLWLHKGSHSAPVAAVGQGGGVVGWTGEF